MKRDKAELDQRPLAFHLRTLSESGMEDEAGGIREQPEMSGGGNSRERSYDVGGRRIGYL